MWWGRAGAGLATLGAAGTLWAGVQAWPGGGRVDLASALSCVVLAAVGLVLAWLAGLLLAAVRALPAATAALVAGAPAGAGHRSRAVQRTVGALLALAALSPATAQAVAPAPGTSVAAMAGATTSAGLGGATTSGGLAGATASAGLTETGEAGLRASLALASAVSSAAPDGTTAAAPAGRDDRAVPRPGWTPTTPTAPRAPSTDVTLVSAAPRESAPETVVVRRGDTLWDIAARHLGPEPTVQDIAEAWPRWYTANLDVVGPDPDLLQPGQELVVPEEDR